MRTYDNYSLLKHNTFGIDVTCQRYIEVSSAATLQRYIRQHIAQQTPPFNQPLIIGRGSNLLFTANYQGNILHSAIRGHQVNQIGDYVMLRCGSGEVWDDVVQLCIDNGWHGIENLSLIPGEIGAAAVQNIGAYGAEIKDVLFEVEAIDLTTGEMMHIPAEQCDYGYRHSRFKTEWKQRFLITHVTLRLSTIFKPNLAYQALGQILQERNIVKPTPQQVRECVIALRQSKLPDPATVGNAGSFFKNPVIDADLYQQLKRRYPDMPAHAIDEKYYKLPAAWLIEQAGWRGVTMGDAAVWQQQPLVLVNLGTTQADDILQLAQAITDDVKQQFNILLQPEVNII